MSTKQTTPQLSELKNAASTLFYEALKEVFPNSDCTLAQLSTVAMYPEDLRLAHVAFPCFNLAKALRKSPQFIAEAISGILSAKSTLGLFEKADAVSGYLNLFVDYSKLYCLWVTKAKLGSFILNPESGCVKLEKVIVEFSQPNTHKALHVGHLRNMIYGDAVCKLLETQGKRVIRATYPGDLGAHIAKSLWYTMKFYINQLPTNNHASWLGNLYAEASQYLKQIEGTEGEFVAREEIGKVLQELERKEGPHYDLYLTTREWSLSEMKAVYAWLGIQFDQWYFESECDQASRELVLSKYKEGFFVKSQGAIGIDLSEYDLGFVLFLKSDGTGLYITKDLELMRRKFSDPEISQSILIVDARQKLHFKQLFKTAELMGYSQTAQSIHLAYETVTDENGEMCSSRSLTGASLNELKELISQEVIQKYLENYRGQWPDHEIHNTAEAISLGSLKYGFLKYDANRVIQFVLKDWIQLEGDTGPYLQYTYARCRGILEKIKPEAGIDKLNWIDTTEKDLLLFLERFPETVALASKDYRPSVLCTYLFDLSKKFNRFYKECSIKAAETPESKNTRLGLVLLVSYTLKEGLGILGISTPDRL